MMVLLVISGISLPKLYFLKLFLAYNLTLADNVHSNVVLTSENGTLDYYTNLLVSVDRLPSKS